LGSRHRPGDWADDATHIDGNAGSVNERQRFVPM
jgi:hypothetical protein